MERRPPTENPPRKKRARGNRGTNPERASHVAFVAKRFGYFITEPPAAFLTVEERLAGEPAPALL
eukprot:11988282-Prorocentrum_lima.AAC.1